MWREARREAISFVFFVMAILAAISVTTLAMRLATRPSSVDTSDTDT
jgi:hypothetical protein